MSGLLKPPRIRPGDLLGIAALSGPADPEALARGVSKLEALGYRVRLAKNATSKGGVLGLSGTDDERVAGYRELVLDPEVKAILFTRGGYGIGRITGKLDAAEIAAHPKIHCGFSDVTALAAFLLTQCGMPSFHGPMVAADFARDLDPLTASTFPSMLEGRGPRELEMPDADVLVEGEMSGRLVGGCLSLLAALVGAPEEFDYDGAIVFFEDILEEAYRIDRMIGTLVRAGRFDRIRGILVGTLTSVTFGGKEDSVRLRQLLLERFSPLGIPVAAGLPCGHRLPNPALPVGAEVVWNPSRRVLEFREEIVS